HPRMLVSRDGEEPRLDRLLVALGFPRSPGARECLLRQVLGHAAIAAQPVEIPEDVVRISAHHCLELAVAGRAEHGRPSHEGWELTIGPAQAVRSNSG